MYSDAKNGVQELTSEENTRRMATLNAKQVVLYSIVGVRARHWDRNNPPGSQKKVPNPAQDLVDELTIRSGSKDAGFRKDTVEASKALAQDALGFGLPAPPGGAPPPGNPQGGGGLAG